jgi:hypothetical protein
MRLFRLVLGEKVEERCHDEIHDRFIQTET